MNASESQPVPPPPSARPRIQFIDLAKGFCILLVILHHVQWSLGTVFVIDKYTMSFRMPLYFFLSGLFFKSYENFAGFLKRKINKLLIPFLFFYILLALLLPYILYYLGVIDKIDYTVGWDGLWGVWTYKPTANPPMWFLWCLFLINIYFYLVYMVSERLPRIQVAFIILACIGLGLWGFELGVPRTRTTLAHLDTALTALPFFCLGFVIRKYTHLLEPNRYDRYLWIAIILLAAYSIYFTHGRVRFIDNKYPDTPFFLYTCGAAGIMAILYLSKLIGHLPVISYLGRYSIIILVTHHPLQRGLVRLLQPTGMPKELIALITLVVMALLYYYILIPLILKYFPYVTAQKDVIKVKGK